MSRPARIVGELIVLDAPRGQLNEAACWDERIERIVWLDIPKGLVHEFDPARGTHAVAQLGHSASAIAPRATGGWLAAIERGFLPFDETWQPQGEVLAAPDQGNETRFNDGHCDPWGNFWAGTMMLNDEQTPDARLYRLSPDGQIATVLTGIIESNGIGWSPDGRTMYYIDSGRGTLDALTLDSRTRLPTSRTTLVRIPASEGIPDGLAVDREGHIWVAIWDGSCVRRYSPHGELVLHVPLPTTRPTSVAFGGAHLRDLYITTASEGLAGAALAAQPLAGSVFRLPTEVEGMKPFAFAA